MRLVRFIAANEGRWSFIRTISGIGGNTYFCLDGIGPIINLDKLNTIPCMCASALSLLDSR